FLLATFTFALNANSDILPIETFILVGNRFYVTPGDGFVGGGDALPSELEASKFQYFAVLVTLCETGELNFRHFHKDIINQLECSGSEDFNAERGFITRIELVEAITSDAQDTVKVGVTACAIHTSDLIPAPVFFFPAL